MRPRPGGATPRGSPRMPDRAPCSSATTAAVTSPTTERRCPSCWRRCWIAGPSRSRRSPSWGTAWAALWLAARATRATRLGTVGGAGAPGRVAGHAAHGRAARGGGAPRRRRAGRAAGIALGRRLPAPPQRGHPGPARGLARGRGLARPRPRRPAPACLPRGPAARERHASLRLRHDHPLTPVTRSAGWWGTGWCWSRAPAVGAAPGASPSGQRTACTWAAPITWRCSTIRWFTRSCATGYSPRY